MEFLIVIFVFFAFIAIIVGKKNWASAAAKATILFVGGIFIILVLAILLA